MSTSVDTIQTQPLSILSDTHESLPYIITDSKSHLAAEIDSLEVDIKALWWRRDITRDWLLTAIEHSYWISVLHRSTGERIAIARCITDYCGFAR